MSFRVFRPRLLLTAAILFTVVVGGPFAFESGAAPNLESSLRYLGQELRCPVCEGQSVAESRSSVAEEMRDEIRQMLQSGKTPQEILDHYVTRYGVWILNSPPKSGFYRLAWLAPFLVLIAGAWAAYRYAHTTQKVCPREATLSERSAAAGNPAERPVAESTADDDDAAKKRLLNYV